MKLKILLTFILLFLISIPAFSQSEDDGFEFLEDGKSIALPDSILSVIKKDSTAVSNSLMKWYFARGYFNVRIDSVNQRRYEITKKCRFRLAELEIHYSGNIDTITTLRNIGDYSQTLLEREIRRLIYELEEDGYAFVSSRISEFNTDFDACNVQVELHIETDMQLKSADIYFSGAAINSQEYLRRISRFNNNSIVNPAFLRSLKSNLSNSELFRSVSDAQIFTKNGQPIIIYQVEERPLNQFDGLIGYVPNKEGKGEIVGDAELSLWNVLLQGNGISLRYQRLKPERSKLNAEISQTWIGNIPIGVSAGFELVQNDTTYQARNFTLDGYYQLASGIRITGGVEYQSTTSGRNLPKVVEPDGRKQIARLGFEYSNLDNYEAPTSGFDMKISWGVANKDLEIDSSSAFLQNMLEFKFKNYIPIFNRSVITPSLHVFFLDADRVTLYDLITFGGANSLRGYEEEQFRAGTMVWGDIEYRFMLNRYSYLFGFAAAGGYERPRLLTEEDNTFYVIDYLYSGGFGLSYRTPIGQIRFSYALSPEESFGNGKIHFGIRTSL